jgi:hypothetical protein
MMQEDIFLVVEKDRGVRKMRKTAPKDRDLKTGQIPIKIKLHVDDSNWEPPYIEKEVVVNRWDSDIAEDDIHLESDYITEEEAKMLVEKRLENKKKVLEENGYVVKKREEIEGESNELVGEETQGEETLV